MGRDSPLGPSPSENTPPSAQGGVANRSGTQRVCWSREGGQQGPSQWHGDGERDHSSLEPSQPRTPTLQPQAGPFLLGRCILAVTARSWAGFGWSCWGWLELAWKGVGLWVAWEKGAQGGSRRDGVHLPYSL